MKKRLLSIIAVLLVAILILTPISEGIAGYAGTDPVAEYQKKLKAAKDLKAEYEKNKAEAERLIKEFSEEKASIEEYISELDLQLNDISLRIFDLKTTIEETEAELENTRKELEIARAREEEQYRIMKERVKYIYESGTTSYMDVMLNSSSISEMLNQMEYVSSIQAYDNSLLERYEQAKQSTIDHEAYLEASLQELEQLKQEEELEQKTVQELMDLKNKQIEELTEKLGIEDELLFTWITEISNQEASIEEIIDAEEKRVAEEERKRKEEEERLRKEQEAAKKAAAQERVNSEELAGIVMKDETNVYNMIWPLPGDHRTYSKFGYRKAPTKGASTYHKGWDIGGEFGAPIVAVLAGTVISVSYNSSAGNFVKIDHGDNFVTVYCHCSKTLVSTGDYVLQGQQIALVGSTGVSTGPHLHFAIQSNGAYIDPNPYIGPLE